MKQTANLFGNPPSLFGNSSNLLGNPTISFKDLNGYDPQNVLKN